MKRKTCFQRILAIALLILTLIGLFPFPTQAHDVYNLHVYIDTTNWLFIGEVSFEKDPFGEGNHIYVQLHRDFSEKNLSDFNLVFPGPEKWEGFKKNHASEIDFDRAYYIAETLIPSLNEAILAERDGQPVNHSLNELEKFKSEVNGVISKYKGTSAYVTSLSKYPGSSEKVTWESLTNHGFILAEQKGITARNSHELDPPNVLEVMLAELISGIVRGLRSLLGLFGIEELVFNRGLRGRDSLFFEGAIPTSVLPTINMMYNLTLAMALSWVGVSIMFLIIKRNAAVITSTPFDLVFFMDGLKTLMLAAFLCVFTRPLLNILLNINSELVNVFSASLPNGKIFGAQVLNSNFFAGTLILLAEFFVIVYINVFYLLRTVKISLLIAGAPLFIMSMTFGKYGTGVFVSWLKELLADIFVQSFHAFCFLFLSQMIGKARGIESLVVLFAFLPLTAFFKSLVFGNAGSLTDKLAGKATSTGIGLAAAGISAGASIGHDTIGSMKNKSKHSSEKTGKSTTQQQTYEGAEIPSSINKNRELVMESEEQSGGSSFEASDLNTSNTEASGVPLNTSNTETSGVSANSVVSKESSKSPLSKHNTTNGVTRDAIRTLGSLSRATAGTAGSIALGGVDVGEVNRMATDGFKDTSKIVGGRIRENASNKGEAKGTDNEGTETKVTTPSADVRATPKEFDEVAVTTESEVYNPSYTIEDDTSDSTKISYQLDTLSLEDHSRIEDILQADYQDLMKAGIVKTSVSNHNEASISLSQMGVNNMKMYMSNEKAYVPDLKRILGALEMPNNAEALPTSSIDEQIIF